jgi:hypothetical protein
MALLIEQRYSYATSDYPHMGHFASTGPNLQGSIIIKMIQIQRNS